MEHVGKAGTFYVSQIRMEQEIRNLDYRYDEVIDIIVHQEVSKGRKM